MYVLAENESWYVGQPYGEALEYCMEDYETNLCSVMKRISFALLPFDIAPCGCLLLLKETYVCMNPLKQGARFLLCFCPCSTFFCFFSPSNTSVSVPFLRAIHIPVRDACQERTNGKQNWQLLFVLKNIYIFIQSNLNSIPSLPPCLTFLCSDECTGWHSLSEVLWFSRAFL